MSKSSISRLFIGAALAMIVGVVVSVVVILSAIASGAVTFGGPDVVTVDGGPFAGMVAWLILAGLAIAGGAVAGIVAWIGALLNTVQLEDKTWFVVLLLLGLFSFGWLAMIAYLLVGPDGTRPREAAIAAHGA